MSPSASPRSVPVRLVLADDHLVLRQALRALLEQAVRQSMPCSAMHQMSPFWT